MPKIIISYRRADSDAISGRIRDRLVKRYGEKSIFMDIDSIPLGTDFRKHIKDVLLETDILLAVVGPNWFGSTTADRTRISEESDPVRIEVETALRRDIPTIPVLVNGTSMPTADQLPESLKDFSSRNATEVDAGRDFHPHMDRLIRSMDSILEGKPKNAHSLRSFGRYGLVLLAACLVILGVMIFALKLPTRLQTTEVRPNSASIPTSPEGTSVGTLASPAVTPAGTPTTPARTTAAKPAGTTFAAQASIVNLLSPDQGGKLEAAPDSSWQKLTSGNEDDFVHVRSGPEAAAVYHFKDKKPATFEKFEILIKGTDMFNPKEIEILAGDDGPRGPFRSVTKCSFMNQLMLDERYQQCMFPPTTASYVMIQLLSSFHFNDWANLPQFRLLGWSTQ